MNDNGTSSGGGNGSVYWSVTHGSAQRPRPIARLHAPGHAVPGAARSAGAPVDVLTPPGRGEVAVASNRVEGHTDTSFNAIGVSNPPRHGDHPGRFRVRLRFRDQDLSKLDPGDVKWIMQRAKRMDLASDSYFLEIDVPAIDRAQPADGQDWEKMPWEIQWEW